jgi:hypothetical protein
MKLTEFSDFLFSEITRISYRNQHYERSAFDPISRQIFERIFSDGIKQAGSVDVSSIWLSRQIGVSRKQVMGRTKHLARYGFIRVQWRKRTDNSLLNEINQVDLNPVLVGIFKQQTGVKSLKSFVEHYFQVGFRRLEDEENDIQGFWTDCKYGFQEPEKGAQPTWQSRLIAFDERQTETVQKKRRENFEWIGYSNGFIDGCGKLWTKCQGMQGYGYNKAVWDNDVSLMPVTAKRERSELAKLFQSYGGMKTAFAWYVFCAGLPQCDEMGKMLWDNKSPHRQYVTVDKKPTQFSKHFNALLADKIFVDIWENKRDEIREQLFQYFGDYINISARINFNQDTIPVSEE